MLEQRLIASIVANALAEDIGRGDLTTQACVPREARGIGIFIAEADGVLAGLPVAMETFHQLGEAQWLEQIEEGAAIRKGEVVGRLRASAGVLLTGERTALNFLQKLSGIATQTARYQQAIAGTGARLADTRKTTPGLRVLEKYAVRMGGGQNHRLGLDDGVMIKDNHIILAGGVRAAVERARQTIPHTIKIEVECDTLAQVDEALEAGADILLLDNMPPEVLREAVKKANKRALLEASGGITIETIRQVAETGVDLISVGALTHSAPILSIRFECELES